MKIKLNKIHKNTLTQDYIDVREGLLFFKVDYTILDDIDVNSKTARNLFISICRTLSEDEVILNFVDSISVDIFRELYESGNKDMNDIAEHIIYSIVEMEFRERLEQGKITQDFYDVSENRNDEIRERKKELTDWAHDVMLDNIKFDVYGPNLETGNRHTVEKLIDGDNIEIELSFSFYVEYDPLDYLNNLNVEYLSEVKGKKMSEMKFKKRKEVKSKKMSEMKLKKGKEVKI